MVEVFLKLKQYYQLAVIENSIMGDARSDNVLSDSEIRLLLETPTNEDGFELLKKIEKNTDTLFQFEKEVREIFPNTPKVKNKTKNLVQKFFTE